MGIVNAAAHAHRVALSTYVILKLYYVGNHCGRDVKLQVTMATMFIVSEVLSMYYNSNFASQRMNSL